jgi:hypothetical protein
MSRGFCKLFLFNFLGTQTANWGGCGGSPSPSGAGRMLFGKIWNFTIIQENL